jgi:hypothetical protein
VVRIINPKPIDDDWAMPPQARTTVPSTAEDHTTNSNTQPQQTQPKNNNNNANKSLGPSRCAASAAAR